MKIISISSGKGGVGKTTFVTQLALQMCQQGKRVVIIDGDMGLANVDIQFGVRPKKNILDVINGDAIKDCMTHISKNLDLLAGGSGIQELTQLNAFQRREIVNLVQELQYSYDIALIDTSSGIYEYVLHLNAIADECVVVITPDATSFTDAYALIKLMNQKYKVQSFSIVCNFLRKETGAEIFLKFSEVVEKFLNVRLHYLGGLEFSESFQIPYYKQVQRQKIKLTPLADASLKHMAYELMNDIDYSTTVSLV